MKTIVANSNQPVICPKCHQKTAADLVVVLAARERYEMKITACTNPGCMACQVTTDSASAFTSNMANVKMTDLPISRC